MIIAFGQMAGNVTDHICTVLPIAPLTNLFYLLNEVTRYSLSYRFCVVLQYVYVCCREFVLKNVFKFVVFWCP